MISDDKNLVPKILITGPFNTGKTTLLRLLATELRSLGLKVATVQDSARTCPLPLNRDQTVDTSIWLLGEQIQNEALARSAGPDVVLCDRGVPDILAHSFIFLGKERLRHTEESYLLDSLASWAKTYELVFATAPTTEIALEADGIRIADELYQAQMAIRHQVALKKLAIDYVALSSSPSTWLEEVISSIKKCQAVATVFSRAFLARETRP